MSIEEIYTKGARIWVADQEYVWRAADTLEDFKGQPTIRIRYEEAEESSIEICLKNLPHLRNPDILIGENDLTSLSYLNEPEVLYNLKVRFLDQNLIYTYCGIVLVAVNPYDHLDIYGNDTINAYSGQDMANMDPHIFAVAEEAFKEMTRFGQNQSIIVSGESGAGKTVSAKYAMRYFAVVGGSRADQQTQVEAKVLASNPIMEAIGNGKTIRNDNSSRFGKYLEINFDRHNAIVGANMRTYLLEKSRVVYQTSEERNYHIFYQICSCKHRKDFNKFGLQDAEGFYFTNQGCSSEIQNVDDEMGLQRTCDALSTLGFSYKDQMMVFQILSAILHFGNIYIKDEESETCEISSSDMSMRSACCLLGIEASQLRMWLCHRKIETVGETLVKPLTQVQASFGRDALAKFLYSKLFDWIVRKINTSFVSTGRHHKFIGVLDIYGFETFNVNSFEQFCINYANEKLQQIFNMHVFKLEQEEYVRENIEWSFIDFYDNQSCIDLIESKLGLLDLLDEECMMPKGSDQNWCCKLYEKHLKTSKHFAKPRTSNSAFIVHHFADKVEYDVNGFLEKNRDTMFEEQVNILKASEFEMVAELCQDRAETATAAQQGRKKGSSTSTQPIRALPKGSNKQHRQTVGSQFQSSLQKLMQTLNATVPHYVRCIKPNDTKAAFSFDPHRVSEQLKACGVLETIRISAAGYPSRWTYSEFFQRYRVLASSDDVKRRANTRQSCQTILPRLITDDDKYGFGKTKIFFRAGQVAYLEKLRGERLRSCGIMIQKHVRRWLQQRKYQSLRRSTICFQTYGRAFLARKKAAFLRQTRAITLLQNTWRCHAARRTFLALLAAVTTAQAFTRSVVARKELRDRLQTRRVSCLQRQVRAFLSVRLFRRTSRGIVLLQSHYRRRKARLQFKILKVEARSVEHIKVMNKGLENKIIELQQKLDSRTREVSIMRQKETEMKDVKCELARLKSLGEQAEMRSVQVVAMEEELLQLRAELESVAEERDVAIQQKEAVLRENQLALTHVLEEKEALQERLESVIHTTAQLEQSSSAELLGDLESARSVIREYDSERLHHQRLVKEHARLQQRFENLQTGFQEPGYDNMTSRKGPVADGRNPIAEDFQPSQTAEGVSVKLMMRLQVRVRDLERERARLHECVDQYKERCSEPSSLVPCSAIDTLKMQELENENDKLKREVGRLMKSIAERACDDGLQSQSSFEEFMHKFEVMNDELERRRDECLQLRALMADTMITTHSVERDLHGGQRNLLNEDNELEIAYKSQQELNRLLQNQLEQVEGELKRKDASYQDEITHLQQENHRQLAVINEGLDLGPEAKFRSLMQYELTRVTSENLDLCETVDIRTEQICRLKKMLKAYAMKMKDGEAAEIAAELDRECQGGEGHVSMGAVIKHRKRNYVGMFDYRKEDEGLLLKNLILDLMPRAMIGETACLPACVIYMCVRYTDHINDDDMVKSLLFGTVNSIRKAVKKHADDLETIVLWLSNTCRLQYMLKQFGGEEHPDQADGLQGQGMGLRNFDLSEYQQVLSDLAIWIYQTLLELMQDLVQHTVVPAILEHEAIAGLTGSKPAGLRGRSFSNTRDAGGQAEGNRHSLDILIRTLNSFLQLLLQLSVDQDLIQQVFCQLYYFMGACSLNNLLLRKDICNWSKGMQVRYNLSHLEQWLRDNNLQHSGALSSLDSIIQASQLLQARKTDSDVDNICEMCSKLTTAQIVKILNLYTPIDEFEERVHTSFIRKIQTCLKQRMDVPSAVSNNTLLLDTKTTFPVTFRFNLPPVHLDAITLPEALNLGFLKKL